MPVDTHPIRILSQRLSIEPFCEQDAVESFPCITPSLTRYMSWEPPASLEEYAQVWGRWLPAIADGSDIVFTIRERVGARFTGLVGLHHTGSETPELGIWVREDKHGLGLGGEAVRAVVQWASQWVVAKYFIYPVATQNRASRRIAEALGGVASKGGWRRNMIRLCIRYRGVSSGHRVCDCWPARTAEIGH
ncbi:MULTISPECIES: GNAT family N-acetyltransferase [Pseudomonas]|uniref:GNAT family N-acetyltransferase n=1 Tax=Pseudomonas TaxID=286 RepID=UPI001FCF2918|nr:MULTISPECIES: GNAT family N-acetyltransferase [Pseudomonas]MDI3249668.1 GNAT family N-acetyltransferase [Pseudomonas sp. AL10]MDI3268358.1 GNAT family N-acetyltransferase [Pseudomonas sp. AL15]